MKKNIMKLITVIYVDLIRALKSEMTDFDLCAFRGYYLNDENRFTDEFFKAPGMRDRLYEFISERLNIKEVPNEADQSEKSGVHEEAKKRYLLDLT
jgi:hypothetical protein